MARKNNAKLLREAEAILGGTVKRHRSVTSKCEHCAENHTTSQHKSHGYGSFNRTHGDPTYRVGRELSMAGADDMLLLLNAPKKRRKRG